MRPEVDWKSIVEARFDRFLALKIGLEMEKIESLTSIPSHPYCNALVNHALYTSYIDIINLRDPELIQKMVIHIELMRNILRVV